MSSAKVAVACGLCMVLLSACGSSAKPAAGTIAPTATKIGHAQIDDPRTKHVTCLLAHKIPAVKVGNTWIQVGAPPSGPVVDFQPTPGSAQQAQISGLTPGAEVIGSALLYPKQASDQLLQIVEDCLAVGVKG
jgi:hypothetical protein